MLARSRIIVINRDEHTAWSTQLVHKSLVELDSRGSNVDGVPAVTTPLHSVLLGRTRLGIPTFATVPQLEPYPARLQEGVAIVATPLCVVTS
jgi:hypothetical protein